MDVLIASHQSLQTKLVQPAPKLRLSCHIAFCMFDAGSNGRGRVWVSLAVESMPSINILAVTLLISGDFNSSAGHPIRFGRVRDRVGPILLVWPIFSSRDIDLIFCLRFFCTNKK